VHGTLLEEYCTCNTLKLKGLDKEESASRSQLKADTQITN